MLRFIRILSVHLTISEEAEEGRRGGGRGEEEEVYCRGLLARPSSLSQQRMLYRPSESGADRGRGEDGGQIGSTAILINTQDGPRLIYTVRRGRRGGYEQRDGQADSFLASLATVVTLLVYSLLFIRVPDR